MPHKLAHDPFMKTVQLLLGVIERVWGGIQTAFLVFFAAAARAWFISAGCHPCILLSLGTLKNKTLLNSINQ